MVAGGQQRERGEGEESCAKKLKPDDAMLTELLETGDSAEESPTKKLRAMRVGMYPPMFAGVNAVGMRENDDEEFAFDECCEGVFWRRKDELSRMYKLQVEGPFPDGARGNGEGISYLKKKYIFTERGIAVQSNSKRTNVLEELYKLHGRKVKMVPEHGELGTLPKHQSLKEKRRRDFGVAWVQQCTWRKREQTYNLRRSLWRRIWPSPRRKQRFVCNT